MSKLLNLGLALEDVVQANTYNAAQAYHLDGLGQLKVGSLADFTIFDVLDCDIEIQDCYHNYQPIHKLIVAKDVIVSKQEDSIVYKVKEGLIK